ncbi:MAG TPA: dihydropteroate synthase [Caldimonas sp.]|jgi:dihydropteroate synthase|nr:dihydropteroate synthase [Caldimonas sp.]HEX2541778.1 dihydropteroate synthase [Caldimonas sp.]
MIWQAGRFDIDLSRPRVMGIVNVTPDSFSDGDPSLTPARAIATCERLLKEGAHLLDLGGESSRPGAEPVSVEAELARLLPVLRAAVTLGCPVSVDTNKPEVMRVVLDLGADIVNDIGALRLPGALEVVAAHPSCGMCLMHMRGTPRSMQAEAVYDDVVADVVAFLREQVGRVTGAGVDAGRIVVDCGIGFAKDVAQNLQLLARHVELLQVGRPVLAGWSRKSSLARVIGLGDVPRAQRTPTQLAALDAASAVAAVLAVQRGASILRVHDVAATVAALAVAQAATLPPPISMAP